MVNLKICGEKDEKKRVFILGSTGSVGRQCLTVCERLGFEVLGIVSNKNVKMLEDKLENLKLKWCVRDERLFKTLKEID